MSLTSDIAIEGRNAFGQPGAIDQTLGGLTGLRRTPPIEEITALVDRPAMLLETLKVTYLGVPGTPDTTNDTILIRFLAEALFNGDRCLHNWYTEDGTEGGTEKTIPPDVLTGIAAYVAGMWIAFQPSVALTFELTRNLGTIIPKGISSEKKGDVAIVFQSRLILGGKGEGEAMNGNQHPGIAAAAAWWGAGFSARKPVLA